MEEPEFPEPTFTDYSGDAFVRRETRQVQEELQADLLRTVSQLKTPNILLIGRTGVGKSSLVNAVFGSTVSAYYACLTLAGEFAKVCSGSPVTKHLSRYAPEGRPVVVFDTKGLEQGAHEEFVFETRAFLASTQASMDVRNHIHLVWYVVDLAHARFQPFEEEILRSLLASLPVLVVLNKADAADEAQIAAMKSAINGLALPNCKGIISVVSARKNYAPSKCPACGSHDFAYRAKKQEITCRADRCKRVSTLSSTEGIDALVAATLSLLPELACMAFLHAHSFSEADRLKMACKVISSCITAAAHSPTLSNDMVHMATRLSLLWDFHILPSAVSQDLAVHYYDLLRSRGAFDRFAVVLSSAHLTSRRSAQALIVLVGAEICRILRDIKASALQRLLPPTTLVEEISERCWRVELSDSLLCATANSLEKHGAHRTVLSVLRLLLNAAPGGPR